MTLNGFAAPSAGASHAPGGGPVTIYHYDHMGYLVTETQPDGTLIRTTSDKGDGFIFYCPRRCRNLCGGIR